MAPVTLIMSEIMSRASRDLTGWRIGITHDIPKQYEHWGKPVSFCSWEADSLETAQELESFFINLGMKGGTDGDLSTGKQTHVYICKV